MSLKTCIINKVKKRIKKPIRKVLRAISRFRNRFTVRQWILLSIFSVLLLVGALMRIPIKYEKTEIGSLRYSTKYKEEKNLELNTEKIITEGQDGKSETKYLYTQSLFDYIFRRSNVKKEVLEVEPVAKPQDEIVLKGKRKWQYMMCSDGSYRYFKDNEF
ncbi:MAG: hypothetical protein QG623_545, partial [Patescibacteria group bacterium]|nr:hypothetical protein [Patescibacteria group bacterium]